MQVLDPLFDEFLKIKSRVGVEFVDTHVHPLDVLGVVMPTAHRLREYTQLKPSLLEQLEYRPFALHTLAFLFHRAPWYIKHEIASRFDNLNEDGLLGELMNAGIDRAVLVPTAPYVEVDDVSTHFKSRAFFRVGSIDPHAVKRDSVENIIAEQIQKYDIKGIKLHPNIQKFLPQPSKNPPPLAAVISRIYEVAEQKKLYLLFHSGISHLLLPEVHTVSYALLENFCDSSGRSEVFKYHIPIVLAHLGHYNVTRTDFRLLRHVCKEYHNIFFDTAGVGPQLIREAAVSIGTNRMVFGSDMPYFSVKFNVRLVLRALRAADTKENFEEKVIRVFSKNYFENILHLH